MFSRQGRTSLQDTLRYCAVFCLSLAMLLSNALAISRVKPSRGDFALCELSAEDKDKFLDEHNKFRGMVDPPAADMEYLFWDEDLANLAQMWSNQCIWDHGFVQFGDEYPNGTPYKGQVGQNLARQWGELPSPEDRVKPWYNEYQYYAYSKYAKPGMGSACARGKVCGHYTQLAWAKTKFVGCGVKWCDKEFGMPHPWVPGETIVACDYAPAGNAIGEYPYKKGTPCSKCASGNGFCYKNLCRDCKNFDSECGKSLLKEMCSTDRDKMAKKCPKMCNLCECPLKCQNGGTVNLQNCVCNCPSGWKGLDCSEKECPPGFYGENCKNRCYDAAGKDTCEWRVRNGHDCQAYYMEIDCALTCGYCDDGSKRTTTPAPVITTVPTPPLTTTLPTTPTTTGMQNLPMPSSPAECKTADLHSSCEMWAAKGECEKNPRWMIPNCCASCKHHRVLKDCSDSSLSCPRWAYNGECEKNRKWMLNNCRKSCNQCGDCKDTDPKCPSWALLKQCSSGDRATWMNTNCRRSCGMCRVYDKHVECPAWSVMEDCNTNYWMRDHCPRSCDVPFALGDRSFTCAALKLWNSPPKEIRSVDTFVSEASFCGGKSDGNYQFPETCLAYTACSNGVTSHVHCQAGMKFDTVKRICEPEDQATCTVVCP